MLMWPRMKLSDTPAVDAHHLHDSPINPQWCLSPLMLLCPPKVHSQLLSFGDIQHEAVVLALE